MKSLKNILSKFSRKEAALLLFVALVLIASLFYCTVKILNKNSSAIPAGNIADNNAEEVAEGLPVRLKIPSINVDANVIAVGLTPKGDMDTPKGPSDVAWFNLGKHPGEIGSAVITGHYGTWKNGGGSVFDNIHKLVKGDKILVENDQGEAVSFVVRESRSYDPQADATSVFSSDDGKAHLNLITCEGIWDKDSKSYSQRLVVFADKE